ncbi:MAG: hypothetical protein ACE5HJ_07420 [Thermoplasmata archaeon]
MTTQQPKEMEALQRWIGAWEAEYTVAFPDGEVQAGTMTVIAAPMAAGQGVHMEAEGTITGMEPWEAHALWGFDSGSGKVHWFAVSSMGEVHDHEGVWKDDETLELEWRGLEEREEAIERTTFYWKSPNEVEMKTFNTVGGKPGHTIEGTWRKQG